MRGIGRRGLFAVALFSLLDAWLRPAKAKAPFFDDLAEFRAFVMAAVKKQIHPDSVVPDPDDPAKFRTTKAGWSLTSDVTNLFGYLKTYPEENVDEAVKRFINSMADAKTRSVDESNIVAVIRHQSYVDAAAGGSPNIRYEPLGADLLTVYMTDRPDSMSAIRSTDLPGRDLASIRETALKNLRLWLPKVGSNDELGAGVLYYVEDNTMLSTGLILLDEFWKSVAARFPGDVLIALPRRDQLFIFDDDGNPATRAAVRRLIAATFEDNFNLLSPNLYARRAGKIVLATD